VLLAVLLPALAIAADRVHVEAAVEPADGFAAGSFTWTTTHDGPAALTELHLFRYPAIYARDPDLDDVLRPRVYPSAFEPGDQQILSLAVDLGTGPRPADREDTTVDGVPITRIVLPRALEPGETAVVTGTFETVIPRKYGTFGHFRGTLTLNGGLAPLPVDRVDGVPRFDALPGPAERSLHLTVPEGWRAVVGGLSPDPPTGLVRPATVAGRSLRVEPAGAARELVLFEAEATRWVSLSFNRRGDTAVQHIPLTDPLTGVGRVVTWHGRPLRRRQIRWIRQAALGAHAALADLGAPDPTDLVLVEAPLRRNLVELGDGVVYVSDRYLEVETLFWRYHDVHLARALMAAELEPLLRLREDPTRGPLAVEGVSWRLVEDYLAARWKNHVNLRTFLAQFSFLPQVDSLLQTPAFPFADQVFDNPWVVDPLRADVRRFNRPLRSGRILLLRLEDRLGPISVSEAARAWITGWLDDPRDFWTVLAERTGDDITPAVDAWLGPAPRINLRLDSVERSRDPDGFWTTRVVLHRDPLEGTPPDERVEIQLRRGPGKRGRIHLNWDGAEELGEFEVRTPFRVAAVRVDPRGRVLENDADGQSLKKDNRLPYATTVTGYGYAFAASADSGLEAYVGLNFRPWRNLQHLVLVKAFADAETRVGSGVSYVHYFGKPRAGSGYRQHRLVGSVDFKWLNTNFRPTAAPLLVEGRASYILDTRGSAINPTRGHRLQVTLFGGKDIALEDERLRTLQESGYLGFDLSAIKLIRMHPWHILALKAQTGLVFGNVVHRQFQLGGPRGLRGLPASHVLGDFRTDVTAEWRHAFFWDGDVPFVAQRIRGLQGNLFLEAGFVSSDLTKAPALSDLGVSVGYGLRTYVDWFGVLPGMFGVEVAWSPGAPNGRIPVFALPQDWPEVPFQVYLVGTQSF